MKCYFNFNSQMGFSYLHIIITSLLFLSTLSVYSQSYYDEDGNEITFVVDNDEDGVLNAYDLDDDNDGIYDTEEACDGDFSFSSFGFHFI